MKEIRAVVRPNRLPALRDALRAIPGFPGMTVASVEGCSAPSRRTPHGIRDELADYTPKTMIYMVADDEAALRLYDAVIAAASTGHVGDGLVWMTDVDKAAYVFAGPDK